jgi:1-acyl-sn-glycerol-3-phosphate acyltransferase
MIQLLASILFALAAAIGSAVIAIGIALGSFSKDWVRAGSHFWACYLVGCARLILGVKLVVRGRVPQEGVIVASKHQSAYEAILTLYLFHHPAVVMKAELRNIPVWGYVAAQHGSIFVARDKAGAALKGMIRQARARAAEGRPIFIFPEGTRVPVDSAPPLKAGLYGIYAGLGCPVVPIAHNAGRVWPKGLVKRRGVVTMAFLPEIPAGLPREELEARVHAAINQDPLTAEVLV